MTEHRPDRLHRDRTQLLVIDIQERLLPQIADHEQVVRRAEQMIRAAAVLDLPITVSEQYKKGLGPTTPPIESAAGVAPHFEKLTFSFCADPACRERIKNVARRQVILVGIETHVCVLQTALDLLDLNLTPYVLADAVGSRRPLDHQIALDLLRQAGGVVTTVESAIFQMVHEAGTDLFKQILPLVR
jgi:nicotinamidase-related amidase